MIQETLPWSPTAVLVRFTLPAIAQESRIPTIIIPLNSGVFSACGECLWLTFAMISPSPTSSPSTRQMSKASIRFYRKLKASLRQIFAQENVPDENIVVTYQMDLRYLGQEHTLSVVVPGHFTEADKAIAGKAFDDLHLANYGHNVHGRIQRVALY